MTEPKKIRFTKDGFFGIKAGDKFEVALSATPEARIMVPHNNDARKPIYVYLDELEGWYEIVRGVDGTEPRPNQTCFYVIFEHGDFAVTSLSYGAFNIDHNSRCYEMYLNGYLFYTKVEADSKAEQIRQIFKEGK